MPQCQPIRPLFDTPKATSSYQKPTPNSVNEHRSSRDSPRACSISPVDTSFVGSLSTADEDESESGTSSCDVSPIEDFHCQNQRAVNGKPPLNLAAQDNVGTSHPSVALLDQTRGRRTYSPHQGSSAITSGLQNDISRKDIPSKVGKTSSTVCVASDTRSMPGPMGSFRPIAPSTKQRGDQGHSFSSICTDTSSPNMTKYDSFRSRGVPTLRPVGKRIIQVATDRQTPSTGSSKPSLETTTQADQIQIRSHSRVLTAIDSGAGDESLNSYPHVAKPVALSTHTRKGISQPQHPSETESKSYNSRVWPEVKTDSDTSGKSLIHSARNGLGHVEWNRSLFSDQPPSRFSDTSCSTITYDSPPSTPENNVEQRIATPALSIVSRKRPVQIIDIQSPNITRRKPTPSEAQKSLSLNHESQGNSKPLPKSPPEAQAVTRVASLEAKLEALRRRRANLQTVVNELTDVTKRSPIVYDMASRQKLKQTIDGLGREISEVGKEEHETGLQLHRAWKREEETSTYDHSTLWVKRLAS